jgi:hypothetical protein
LILTAVALGLGAVGAIHEFAEKTAHFLFTKPRSRAYFVWAGWAVGFAELAAVAAVNFLAGWATLSHYSKNPFHSTLNGSMTAENFLVELIFCIWAYCLTYSLTVLLRNGLKGLSIGVGAAFSGITLPRSGLLAPPHDSLLQHARYTCRCLQFDSEIGSAKRHSERPRDGQDSEGRLEYFSQKKRGECDFLDAGANHSMKGKYTEERRQEGNQDR